MAVVGLMRMRRMLLKTLEIRAIHDGHGHDREKALSNMSNSVTFEGLGYHVLVWAHVGTHCNLCPDGCSFFFF